MSDVVVCSCRPRVAAAVLVGLLVGMAGKAGGQTVREESAHYRAMDAAQDNRFGWSVARGGSYVVSGSPYTTAGGGYTGSAYVFDAASGQHLHELVAAIPAANGYFGYSVAIDGDTVVVGVPGAGTYGEVQVFSASTGAPVRTLSPVLPIDSLGVSVAISGSIVLAGSDGLGVAVFNAATGQDIRRLLPSDHAPTESIGFGLSVDMYGDFAVVGAPYETDGVTYVGAVYVYSVFTGEELYKLTPPGANPSSYFGYSVATNGSIVLAGAPDIPGRVYVFDGQTGAHIRTVSSPHPTEDFTFGQALAARGNAIVVGSPNDYGAAGDPGNQGFVYVYNALTGQLAFELHQSDPALAPNGGDLFGYSVATDGSSVVAGAPYDNDADDTVFDTGSAYGFSLAPRVLSISPSRVVNAGSSPVNFSVTGEGISEYLWRRDGVDLSEGGEYSGTMTSTLTITPTLSAMAEYDVVATGAFGETVSPVAVLGVRQVCPADTNGDGLLDFFDVQRFLNDFSAGCP